MCRPVALAVRVFHGKIGMVLPELAELISRGVSTVERSLWVSAMLVVVLASGCEYSSRQEPSSGATVEDDDAGSIGGTQGQSAGLPSAVLAQAGEGDSQAGTAEDETEALTVEIVRMERKSKKELPLEQDRLSACLSEGAGRTTLTVVGERRRYDLQLRLVSEGEAQEWSGDLWCCELRSTDPEVPFVWAVWSEEPMVNFRVVTSPRPVSYVAWVQRGMLYFKEIAASRDADTALAEYFSRCAQRSEAGSPTWDADTSLAEHCSPPDPSTVVRLRMTWKMGAEDFIGRHSSGLDIRAQSIAKDDTGQWTVRATGPNSRKVYTFVSADGITWERK